MAGGQDSVRRPEAGACLFKPPFLTLSGRFQAIIPFLIRRGWQCSTRPHGESQVWCYLSAAVAPLRPIRLRRPLRRSPLRAREKENVVDDDPAKNSDYQSRLQLDAQIDAQIRTVTAEIANNPETAYQDAMGLPLRRALGPGCPRASAMKRVALGIGKKNSTLARAAMNEARRLAQDVDPARQAP